MGDNQISALQVEGVGSSANLPIGASSDAWCASPSSDEPRCIMSFNRNLRRKKSLVPLFALFSIKETLPVLLNRTTLKHRLCDRHFSQACSSRLLPGLSSNLFQPQKCWLVRSYCDRLKTDLNSQQSGSLQGYTDVVQEWNLIMVNTSWTSFLTVGLTFWASLQVYSRWVYKSLTRRLGWKSYNC